ncbi:MAG: hypothetical protein FWG88_00660 [Oscillospiraceae bacterium]|nr:hypothetical protein [Oscillospiraceae bacterium]
MIEVNGELMSKDKAIAEISNGLIIGYDPELLPLFLLRTKDFEGWLQGRAIDMHRTNSRILKRALRLTTDDDAELVLKVHAATITDTYWFRENGSSLSYDDVRFKANYFDKLALNGDPDSFNLEYSPTPELTNIGSFEKCWRLEDGKWWMVKQGNNLERFSELFIARLGQALGFSMAEYYAENGTVKSPDFTDGASVNYESAHGIVGDDEDYKLNFDAFMELSPILAKQYLEIIYLDTICFNMDRHTRNYGILRDVETGDILGMAPNFDNNIALFARGVPKEIARNNDRLILLYSDLLRTDKQAFEQTRTLPVPTVDMIKLCTQDITLPVDIETLTAFLMNGSNHIQAML